MPGRPRLRRRSNSGEPRDVTGREGKRVDDGSTRAPLASVERTGAAKTPAAGHRKTRQHSHNGSFQIFADQRKRKRSSPAWGLARARSVQGQYESSTQDEDSSPSEYEASGDDNEQGALIHSLASPLAAHSKPHTDDDYYLEDAAAAELCRLTKEKLVELARIATGQTARTLEALTKTALADGIIDKRPSSSDSLNIRRPRHARTISLPSIGDLSISQRTPSGSRQARLGRSTSDTVGQSTARPTRRRTRSSGGSVPLSEDNRRVAFEQQIDEEGSSSEDEDDEAAAERKRKWREPTPAVCREPTPVAHRTRRRSSKNEAPAMPALPKQFLQRLAGHALNTQVAKSDIEQEEAPRNPPRRQRRTVIVISSDDEDENGSEDEVGSQIDELASDQGESEPDNDEISREHLTRLKRDALIAMCDERGLSNDGIKKDLVEALVRWKEQHLDGDYIPSSAPSSSGSSADMSAAVGVTPRHETKTQALAAVDSIPSNLTKKPRLLDSEALSIGTSPPETPAIESDEDIETLDLDSLGLTDKAIAPEKLKRGDKIGSGGFKDVFIGKYRNVKVAIADLRDGLTENDIKELLLLRDLQHVNIVRFIGVSVPDEPRATGTPACSLVTELCPNGDLFDYLRSGVEAPSQRALFKMMHDITCGLEYLHDRTPRIIHRDMKSSNVLITARGVAKINDFGLARVKTSTRSVIKSLVGTVNWQAPELWAPKPKYNEKVDVYATGLVFWEMLQFHMSSKRYPFEGSNEHAIYHDVGQLGMRPPTATMGRKWGAEILELVNQMWAQQPGDRPDMSEVRTELEGLIAAL